MAGNFGAEKQKAYNKLPVAVLAGIILCAFVLMGYFLIKYPIDIPFFNERQRGEYAGRIGIVSFLCAFSVIGIVFYYLLYPQKRRPPRPERNNSMPPLRRIWHLRSYRRAMMILSIVMWSILVIYTLIYGIIPGVLWSLQN